MADDRVLLGPRKRDLLLTAADTKGAYAIREVETPVGRCVPKHVHSRESEAWYVLVGELTFTLEDREFVALPGGLVYLPIGIAHGFRNSGASPARFLQIFAPAGLERYFEERAALVSEGGAGLDYAGLPPALHAALAEKYGLRFLED